MDKWAGRQNGGNQCHETEKRMKRNEDSLRDLWDNIKHTNIRIIGVPEGEEREKGPEKTFEEIIVENFPNMGKEIATQVQDMQRVYEMKCKEKVLEKGHIVTFCRIFPCFSKGSMMKSEAAL